MEMESFLKKDRDTLLDYCVKVCYNAVSSREAACAKERKQCMNRFAVDKLPKDEQLTLELSNLYEGFGYKRYRMAKFEEYTLYSDHRDFLPTQNVITFQGPSGRLMALKPDVTLSVIKNSQLTDHGMTKLYYNETVYRGGFSGGDIHEFRQIGAEQLGEIDAYSSAEMVRMAGESLGRIDEDFILAISHMQLIAGQLEQLGLSTSEEKQLMRLIRERNLHELQTLCLEKGVEPEKLERLTGMLSLGGPLHEALKTLRTLVTGEAMCEALRELERIAALLAGCEYADRIVFDLTVINHLDYYNGIVFQGYVRRMPEAVLSGGRYDRLMHKVRKNMGAIGFAVYLDKLNLYYPNRPACDADILVLKETDEAEERLLAQVDAWMKQGFRVRVDLARPEHYRAERTYRFTKQGLQEVTTC